MRIKKNQYIKNILLLLNLFMMVTVNMYFSALASNDFASSSIITLYVLANVFFAIVIVLVNKILDLLVNNQGILTDKKKRITATRVIVAITVFLMLLFVLYSVYATSSNNFFMNYSFVAIN